MIKPSDLARAVGFVAWIGGWHLDQGTGRKWRRFAHRDSDSGPLFGFGLVSSAVVVEPNGNARVLTPLAWMARRALYRPLHLTLGVAGV